MHCPYLKNGLTIRHNGDMVPCCVFTGHTGLNVKNISIENYFKSNALKNLNNNLENNNWPAGCISCESKEKNKQLSLRLNSIPLEYMFEKYYIDIEIGNECNSDCVMCNAESSTKIVSRIKKHGTIDEIKYNLDFLKENWRWYDEDKTWNEIENNIEQIGSIKFLGGEPFLSKKIWSWLEKDNIQKNKHNIILQITTNASFLPEQKLSLLNGWKKLIINVSIDSIEEQFEWIRQGLTWKPVEENTKQLSLLENSIISIQFVASIYSITGAVKLLQWADKNNYLSSMITLTKPEYLQLVHAPVLVLEQVLSELKETKLKIKQNKIQLLSLINLVNQAIRHNKYNQTILNKITDYFNNHRASNMDSITLTLEKNKFNE